MALDPSIIVLGGIAVGGLTAYCMIQEHKRDTDKRVRPMFVKSDDVLYLPFNRRATVLDVRVKSGQAQYNLDLFGFNEWINEGDLSKWEPKKPEPTASVTGSRAAQSRSPVADAARQARQTRERRQEEARRRRDDDDILTNPAHPLSPVHSNFISDPTPSRSSSYDDCGSSSRSSSYSHSSHSHSCSGSSSSSDSSSSSSDSGSSSSD